VAKHRVFGASFPITEGFTSVSMD